MLMGFFFYLDRQQCQTNVKGKNTGDVLGGKGAGELVFSKQSKEQVMFLGNEEGMGWILYQL